MRPQRRGLARLACFAALSVARCDDFRSIEALRDGAATLDAPVVTDGPAPVLDAADALDGFDAPDAPDAPPMDAGPLIGRACRSSADCEGRTCVLEAMGFPGGYCTTGCGADAGCGDGALCATLGESRVCLAQCAPGNPALDCPRAGYVCYQVPDAPTLGACIADCRRRSDAIGCGPSARCNATTGICDRVDAGRDATADAQGD